MTKKIPVGNNHYSIIDDEDFEALGQMRWNQSEGYAWCRSGGNYTNMQNFLMNPPPGMVVDHIDRDKLNNQKSNLRICTMLQNLHNRDFTKSRSVYRGVTRNTKNGSPQSRWIARIFHDNQPIYLGRFPTQEEAARAYDAKAVELRGKYAFTNFPREGRPDDK